MCLVMELIPLPESLSLHKLRVSPVLLKTKADLNIQYGRTIRTSSTFLLSFALVSNTWIPICSANFTASSFTTTFFSGLSSLLPTWEKQNKIKLQSCKPTKYHRYYKPGLQTANLIANFFSNHHDDLNSCSLECWLQVLLSCHCFCFHCTVHINYSWHQDYFMTSKQENLHVNQYIQRLEAKTPRHNSGWWEEHTISALFSFFYCNVIK